MCTYILSNMTNLFLNNSLAKAMIFVAPTISAPVRGQFFDRTVSSPFPCRYLTMSQEELLRTTTLLTEEEMDALMTCLHQEQQSSGGGLGSVISQLATGFLPDHLLEMQSVMRTRRKAREKEEHGIKKLSAAAKKFKDGSKGDKHDGHGGHGGNAGSSVATAAIELERQRRNLKAETQQTQKEKFNFVEEFFICLACIFD